MRRIVAPENIGTMLQPRHNRGIYGALAVLPERAAALVGCNRMPPRNGTTPARPPRTRNGAIWRLFQDIGHCRRGVAALEFAIVVTPLMLMVFGFIAASAVFYVWSTMQNNAQYAALMVATGQVTSINTGALSTSNTTATTKCTGSFKTTQAEYYACTGLPAWATFTVTTTETCATPSVAVTLSVSATAAAIEDVFSIFSGKTITASTTVMKEGTCP
jgi:Flp pilus assembly protein TadG